MFGGESTTYLLPGPLQYQDQNQSRTLSYNKATYILEIFGSNSTTNKQSHFVQGHAQKENLGVGFLFGGVSIEFAYISAF